MKIIFCFTFLLCLVFARLNADFGEDSIVGTSKTFENFIDHFNQKEIGKYKQRYFEASEFWNPAKPKVILYICGVFPPCLISNKTLPYVAASETKALLFALEHRFYGQSQPMKDWSTESLKYLTSSQGLADIAYFIEKTNDDIQKKYGVIPKWVVYGGSYAGALSAWFRYKYPHLAAGSIASSAVVRAVLDFPEYEMQMMTNLDKCSGKSKVDILRSYQIYATEIMLSKDVEKKRKFLEIFHAPDMGILDFSFFFADLSTYLMIFGNLKGLCDYIDTIDKTGKPIEEQIKMLADMVAGFGITAELYKFAHLKNTTIDFDSVDRQWDYQFCSAFGFLQTPYGKNPMRWEGMNFTYWVDFCREVFNTTFPDPGHTNIIFGGETIAKFGSKIYFTQGVEDSWKWVGIRDNIYENKEILTTTIDCFGCSHCVDLKAAKDTDPEVVKQARKKIIQVISNWLN